MMTLHHFTAPRWFAARGGEEQVERIRQPMHNVILEAVAGGRSGFFGVQTYSRTRVGRDGALGPEPGIETTQMGYELWPDALEACLREAWAATHKPLIVIENGIGTAGDTRRIAFIEQALQGVHRAIHHGIDGRGYMYWSAIDNFEWALGYRPTFGLIAVDRANQRRTPNPSACWFQQVITRSGIDDQIAGVTASIETVSRPVGVGNGDVEERG